jgi:hypothetical protein
MTLLWEVATELVAMFIGDLRLTIAILAIVAATGLSINLVGLQPLVGGAVLLLGCPILLIENVRRAAGPRSATGKS